MTQMLKKINPLLLVGILFIAMPFAGCKKGCKDPMATNYDEKAKKDDGSCTYDEGLEVPVAYNFDNVFYGGQTARILLLKDLEAKMAEAANPGTVTAQELTDIFQNTAGNYQDIGGSAKDLESKFLASGANAGIQQEWLDSINVWFAEIETLSASDTYIRDDGTDLKQMVEKVCMGAVFYDQAINNYLQLVPNDDNDVITPGEGTDMEHHWDEAFGYFGAARDYASYTDDMIASPGEKDSDASGDIDPTSEKCFYYSQTAAKRDLGSASFPEASQTDYTQTAIDNWLLGRAAISSIEYAERDIASAAVIDVWEKMIAATVIHYINDTRADLPGGASEDLSKHWSEMVGYYRMLTFYPNNKVSQFNAVLVGYLGYNPSDASDGDLDDAAGIIGDAYGFTDDQVYNW